MSRRVKIVVRRLSYVTVDMLTLKLMAVQAMTEMASASIETAFDVPPQILREIWEIVLGWMSTDRFSAILTIPTEDRVASLLLSIPRADAIDMGDQYQLPTIYRSTLA